MRFFVFEYDTFYIGVITWTERSDQCIKYAMEIHALFLDDKPFYVFFSDAIAVLTYKDTNDEMIELEVAGTFERTPMPSIAPPTCHLFKFDPNDTEFSIEASLNRKTGPKTRQDLERSLKTFQAIRYLTGFDVYRTILN